MHLFYQSLKHISEDDADSLTYDYATHYSYDVSGNVYTLVQELGGLRGTGNDFKRMDYEYDLVSGKVNQVNYQPDSADQYYYQYIYDEDNRLVNALTSIDNHLWQNEATYLYYKHGPLRRTEIGERQVQGMDFAYTLQGWLKGMNSEGRDQGKDMGGDGKTSGAHKLFGRDVASFLLSYFEGDYRPIGTNRFTATYSTSGGFGASSPSLYNGNIRKATYSLANLTDPVVGYAYGYDQLNRLVSMDAWVNFNTGTYAWQTSGSASSKLQERVTYDANGNITKYLRKGYSPTNMDSLTYKYYPKSNKLKRVDDAISDGTYTDIDVDDQDNNNYDYDLTGNLVKDSIEGISLITWNLMGKVDSIARYGSSSRPELKFLYDAMGNRVGKVVYDGSDISKTWYIRDAQGNIMATYEEENDTLTWAEQHIYGSSRLGYWQPDSMMFPKPALPATDTFRYKVKAGDKLYEIANHLGNVLATITDRKIPKETGTPNGIADYYVADIATVQDYYPFGMVMPGRNWTAGTAEGYGFGFNGELKDDDISGNGNIYDYGFRIYNPRIGKFISLDPLAKSYPWYSPYHFAGNSPVRNIDLDGLEEYSRVEYSYQGVVFLTITSRLETNNRAHVGDNNDASRIDQGIYVKKIELTPAEFQTFTAASVENPADYKAVYDFFAGDVIADPNSVLSAYEKAELDKTANAGSGGGDTKLWIYTPQRVNLNFNTNDASASTVQNAYNTDRQFATKVDITAFLLINFPAATLSISGYTDADPTTYVSTDPSNPFGTTPGNDALSWDRANVLGQFIAQRASAASGQSSASFSTRITPNGRGVARGASTSDSEAEKASQRKFVMNLTGG